MPRLSRTPLPKQTGGPHGPRGKEPIDDTQEQLESMWLNCTECGGTGSLRSFDPEEEARGIEDTCYRCSGTGRWAVTIAEAEELLAQAIAARPDLLLHRDDIRGFSLETALGQTLVDGHASTHPYEFFREAYHTCEEILDEWQDDPLFEGTDAQGEIISLRDFFRGLIRPEDR